MSQMSFEGVVMRGFKEIDAFFSDFFDKFTETYNLSSVQVKALLEVKINKAISMKDLCQKLNMSKSNLSPVCKKLEGAKLLRKTRDFHDQRIVNLELTEEGEDLLDSLRTRIDEYTQPYFDKLTEQEKQIVIQGFSILVDSLKR